MIQSYKKTFTSPINEDTGSHQRFLGHARSEMELFHFGDTATGMITWCYHFIDGEHNGKFNFAEINLYFNGRRLVRFDGVHELCDEAIELLEEHGFDAAYARS